MENYWSKWSFNTFLEAVATVDVFVASNNDVKLAETWTVRFACLKSSYCFENMKKLYLNYSYCQIFISCLFPET